MEGLEYAEFPGYVGYYNPLGLWDSYPHLMEHVLDRGVEIMYETPAVDFFVNAAGEVIGAYAESSGKRIAVQKLAYPFFLLTYAHLVIVLACAAGHGGAAAQATIGVYSVVFGLYAVLRVHRALVDGRETRGPAREALD